MIQYKVHVQINVYTNVPHTVHVLFILSKISSRTCLRTFEADIPMCEVPNGKVFQLLWSEIGYDVSVLDKAVAICHIALV